MITIAVVGANGFVGSALSSVLAQCSDYSLTRIMRTNYAEMRKQSFDILINSATPSARFWAKNNPDKDFMETVQKTADLVYGWRFGKIVQISTVSARCQLHTVYGRHKAAAEKLCGFGENLIVRLGPMYGKDLSKGVLIDMLQGRKVFADGESRYCFAPVEFVASWIATHLGQSGIIEVGSRNAIKLREVADYLEADIEFEGMIDNQEIQNPGPDYPDVREVFTFLSGIRATAQKET